MRLEKKTDAAREGAKSENKEDGKDRVSSNIIHWESLSDLGLLNREIKIDPGNKDREITSE